MKRMKTRTRRFKRWRRSSIRSLQTSTIKAPAARLMGKIIIITCSSLNLNTPRDTSKGVCRRPRHLSRSCKLWHSRARIGNSSQLDLLRTNWRCKRCSRPNTIWIWMTRGIPIIMSISSSHSKSVICNETSKDWMKWKNSKNSLNYSKTRPRRRNL